MRRQKEREQARAASDFEDVEGGEDVGRREAGEVGLEGQGGGELDGGVGVPVCGVGVEAGVADGGVRGGGGGGGGGGWGWVCGCCHFEWVGSCLLSKVEVRMKLMIWLWLCCVFMFMSEFAWLLLLNGESMMSCLPSK